MPKIVLETLLPATPAECFELSLSVDAHTGSMSRYGERAVAGVTTGAMALGESVTWRARHFGLPFTMTSTITEHQAPHRFVDEQTKGPFKRWWHEHRFEQDGDATRMTDVVEFAAPLGLLGRTVETLVLTHYMTRLLAERNEALQQILTDRRA
ncbi:SRPBCC family protein [Aeromicrobium sp. Leaf350]|uniref:SRPBCC family protein n=1 Tax=Aeromicrobium sp. Leaf350 TaxID=2876565 RepID=UPI001E4446D0|nr:SRPBCC family protein [Aeromicrobium sp. Leaf350]